MLMRNAGDSALLTDLYEIAMLQAYFEKEMNAIAVFEFFVRRLPENRAFLMAAGLEQALNYLFNLHFGERDIEWLHSLGRFDAAFIDSLEAFRFSGDVDAMPEGTIFFPDEPILRITAPLPQAQFVESRIINLLHFQTVIASKAVRSVMAAKGRQLVDFGMRRAHGAEAALLSARASFIAGFDGSATVEAGYAFNIPVFGTMAHSFIQAHETELDAFSSFVHSFPHGATLLIDTYDIREGAENVVRIARKLKQVSAPGIKAVRIDSGDLRSAVADARAILDAGGCQDIAILVSGGLDEYAIEDLVRHRAPIDGYGIGTCMNTSSDAPCLDCAYKMVEYNGQPKRKRSSGKATWPGRKQVYRWHDKNGYIEADTLTTDDDVLAPSGLLQPVVREGRITRPLPSLLEIRAFARSQLLTLPPTLRTLAEARYEVKVSDRLWELAKLADARQLQAAEMRKPAWMT